MSDKYYTDSRLTDAVLKNEATQIFIEAITIFFEGLKNFGQSGDKFVKNLPEQTKNLLQENGILKQSFKAHYVSFKSKLLYSKALGEHDGLGAPTKDDLSKQEQISDEFVKGLDVGKRTITQHEIDAYATKATYTNPKEYKQVMLGKYDHGAETSYIKRAGEDYTYFDIGANGGE